MNVKRTNPLKLSGKQRIVLEALEDGADHYGLELVENSAGRLPRGTIYVLLQRLQERKMVTSRKEKKSPGEGPPKRLWEIAARGVEALQSARDAAAEAARKKAEEDAGCNGLRLVPLGEGVKGMMKCPGCLHCAPGANVEKKGDY